MNRSDSSIAAPSKTMSVEGIENGQQELEAKHFSKAEACFDLMSQVNRRAVARRCFWLETHVARGKKKQADRDLQESVQRGYRDADAIESDSEFQTLKAEPDFQKLLADLAKAKSEVKAWGADASSAPRSEATRTIAQIFHVLHRTKTFIARFARNPGRMRPGLHS